MATVGVINGTLFRLRADTDGGSPTYDIVGNSQDVTLNYSHSARETTDQDSGGHAEFLEGKRSKTIDFSALYEEGATNEFKKWYDNLDGSNRGLVAMRVTTNVSGDSAVTYTGYVTNLSMSSGGPEANVTFSGSIQVTGKGALTTL
jgi:hypothetical protein